MSEERPALISTLTEEEEHRRRWLQYALQTPQPRPINPTRQNSEQETSRGITRFR